MKEEQEFFKPSATLSEAVYKYLKEFIIKGEIKAGQRLQEKEFAELFNVSTTPVREAFFRLAAEKYLVINSRKEVFVDEKSPEEILEIYEVVKILDRLALTKFCRSITQDELEILKKMTRKLREYYREKKNRKYLDQNIKIHRFIWKSCGNIYLYELLDNMMKKAYAYHNCRGFVPFSNKKAWEKSLREHVSLLEGLKRKNNELLEKTLHDHWGNEFA